jgi:hypothetical protein
MAYYSSADERKGTTLVIRVTRRGDPYCGLGGPQARTRPSQGSNDAWQGELRPLCDRVFRSVVAFLEAADHNKPGDKHGHHRDEQRQF